MGYLKRVAEIGRSVSEFAQLLRGVMWHRTVALSLVSCSVDAPVREDRDGHEDEAYPDKHEFNAVCRRVTVCDLVFWK